MSDKFVIEKKGTKSSEKREFILAESLITVGADQMATLVLSDEEIAPEQFAVMREGASALLLNRAAGTRLNGEKLPQGAQRELHKGDEIKIGNYIIHFSRNGYNQPENRSAETFIENYPAAQNDIADETLHRSFADVLSNLRQEDRFYFQIESIEHGRQRVVMECEEMMLGWDLSGKVLTFEENAIITPRAKVRKDWSGVIIYPFEDGAVEVNNNLLSEPQRLKNGDKLMFIGDESQTVDATTLITFYEPTALVVLNSILPKDLPPPVMLESLTENEAAENAGIIGDIAPAAPSPEARGRKLSASSAVQTPHRLFYYFTLTEMLIMLFGTLFAAAIIFLILEFS